MMKPKVDFTWMEYIIGKKKTGASFPSCEQQFQRDDWQQAPGDPAALPAERSAS